MANKIITTDTLKTVLTDVANSITDINEQIHEPLSLELVNDNNNFSVGVDNNGTKYDAIESSESTIELNGRTLVNLWGNKPEHFNRNLNQTKFENGIMKVVANGTNITCMNKRIELFKPSTEYTIILTIFKNTLNEKFYLTSVGGVEGAFGCATTYLAGTTGTFVLKLRTMDDISNCKYALRSYVNTSCSTGEIEFQCIILEGDYTNVPIEYFEGLQSSEPTEIKSIGKNLVDINEPINFEVSTKVDRWIECLKEPIDLNPKETYNFSALFETNNLKQTPDTSLLYVSMRISFINEDGTIIDNFHNDSKTSTTIQSEGAFETTFTKVITGAKKITNIYILLARCSCTGSVRNITLTNANFENVYEPYKENIVTLPNIEPLRSLPNGICDEAFIHDDKLVITRNIHKITLDGSEKIDWKISNHQTETNSTYFNTELNLPTMFSTHTYGQVWDRFKAENPYTSLNNCAFMLNKSNTTNTVFLRFNVSEIEQTSEAFNTWLSNNNVTAIYRIAEPTYEWYELPSPHLYKDGNVFIDSGSVPLTSTTHNIDLSVRSIIETNVEEIVQLKEELNALELELSSEEDVSELINIFKEGE